MERNRTCILCETVHVSKQEMEEHMRSMLHHRELEKLKGRDCGHECRVCKVTVVSLTDYASHISSPTHKQNVEATEQNPAGKDRDEEYFDQVLVDLIAKRKEQIRKEKEAADAKLAKEEEDRKRKDEFQQRLRETKERYQLDRAWQKSSYGFSGYSQQSSWCRNHRYNAREGEVRPLLPIKQGKSATWHAEEPPNFQHWASGEFNGGSLHSREGWGNKQWDQGAFSASQRNRLPWLSNGGSSNGLYGRNNIAQSLQKGRPLSLMGPPMYPPPPTLCVETFTQFKNSGNGQRAQRGDGLTNGEGQTTESNHNSNKSSKALGSNPKLDKVCRWSPYPVTKGLESVPHNDSTPKSPEMHTKVPKLQRHDKTLESKALKRQSQPEKKARQMTSTGKSVEDKMRHTATLKTKPRDRSSSRSSSAQRGNHHNTASGSSSQMAYTSLLHKDQKIPLLSDPPKTSNTSISTTKSSVFSTQAPPSGPFQSRQERQHPDALMKARQIVLEKKSSVDSSRNNRNQMAQHTVDEQKNDEQGHVGFNKENSCRQNHVKPNLPDLVGPELPTSSDSSQFLQSFQVSTSTMESSEPSASNKEDEESERKDEKDEGMQAVEAGQSSESDTSRTGEAQLVSDSNTSGLSKLDLPPVLKRDLTKHISSKSKAVSHEPNLNIARRVRNLSESRRGDTEKDSGLKPTVRQLISSSGSRRNVNWEQVYQEVRKKQDKGKGMPRFGIEMVPLDQEDQSQEEDDIPLLEGFQWDSLMDMSTSGVSRKRSLSESSLAPASNHSLFTPQMSKETAQREVHSSQEQGSSVSENKDNQHQEELEQKLGEFEAKAQKQTERLTSSTEKMRQRCDSVLRDSSSGTEQHDSQGTGKRRRAAGDVPSVETSCLEHNNKRRKVKPKKERLQIDQLLSVSLREEELNRTLQTVDDSLIQARAALQAAYMEVQRLMVVKQQMTGEMNTLRNKRIDLLKGMQDSRAESPHVKLKEEKMDPVEPEPHIPPSFVLSTVIDTPAVASPSPPAEHAPTPSSTLPFMHVSIKEEPQSPVHVISDLDPVDGNSHFAHSTTSERQAGTAAASPPEVAFNSQPSPEEKPELYPTEYNWENLGVSADSKESSSVQMTEKAVQVTKTCVISLPDVKPSLKPQSRRDSDLGSVVDCAATRSTESPSGLSLMPTSPSELKSGKRVRKLKKRKVLKKAHGTEQPESSDTEFDEDALRPRWLRLRRRPSGGSQGNTSTQPSEDRNTDMKMEVGGEASRQLIQSTRQEQADPKFLKNKGEVSLPELTLNLDLEESMEITAACQQPNMGALLPASLLAWVPDTSRPEPQSLACNEVTSTSDIDICKSSESDVQGTIILPKLMKASSDVLSSDHGEDDMPTEGAFHGHQEAVNAMQIHNGLLYTCSGDRTVRAFDLVSRKCVGVFEGHSSKVSCLLVSAAPSLHHRLYSGSSDQTIRCYSLKTREVEQQFCLSDRVLCLHSRWKTLYAGLANGTVVTFNLKTNKQAEVFECHGPRAVSCLASTQEGARRILLVGSYDSTISVRDAKSGLLLRTLEGHSKTVLCMSVVNDLVFSGSSDQCVYTHNIHTGELVRVYKGHSHAVTVVTVLGKVMVTACLDKLVRVYDLQCHGQLQVYGGHSDMVMCMAIHQNMIYTGCYDGSVRAVKLNLLQNFRCRWYGCSLVFGAMEHLQHHLISDHASASIQTPLKCRWKSCEEFLCARTSSKQGLLVHMQKHAEEETDPEL